MKKSLIIGLLLLGSTCFATTIATKPTVYFGIDRSEAQNSYSTAQMDMYRVQFEVPTSAKSHFLALYGWGSKYGVDYKNYSLGCKWEL